MFLDRLLNKRRPGAPKNLSQDELVALARGGGDRGARMDAARRLTALGPLRDILADEQDPGVREIAFGRYRSLLCGAESDAPPVQARCAEIARAADLRLIEHVAQEAEAAEVRLAAIQRVEDSAILITCALHDPRSSNRAAAQERIHDRDALEQVARRIGKKDKGVYRAVRERLRRMAEEDARPRLVRTQCEELCERLGQLGRLDQWSQDRALLDHLVHQFSEIAPEAEPELRERFEHLRSEFLAAYGAWRDANAAAIEARESREADQAARLALVDALTQAADLDDEEAMRCERERLVAEWAALGDPAEGSDGGAGKRFSRALGRLDDALDRAKQQRAQRGKLLRAISRAEVLAEQSQPLERRAVHELIERGRELAEADADADLRERFSALAERLESRLEGQRKRAKQRLDELPGRLEELEEALEAGELKRAEPLMQSVQSIIDLARSSAAGGGDLADAQDRVRRMAPRVRDLKQWRRWGADRHREALCDAMESLRDEDMPLAAVVERLHVLQQDWKDLDHSGAPANQRLWDRFHAAGGAVFERCRPVLEAEAAERGHNREAREAVCAQLEAFLADVDWGRVDWRRLMQAERETRRAWAAIGPCELKERRRLDRRFHKSIKALDRRLDEERERNQALKRDLIRRAQALVDAPDLGAAIDEVKSLQRQWQTTVPARQRDEHRLWSELRAACDAVFERRAAAHQAHRAELGENLAAKEAVCAEAESGLAEIADADALAEAHRQLLRRWDDLDGLPLPRDAAAALVKRWRGLSKSIEARVRALGDARRDAELDSLARRAEVCESLERLVLAGDGAPDKSAADALVAAWGGLPALDDTSLQAGMQRRFDAALAAVGDPARRDALGASLAANAERRGLLCLELEIAAGVDSPPALARERLRLQVERLSERLGEGERDPVGDMAALLRDWYLCAPAPADAGLDERIARVRVALKSSGPAGAGAGAGQED